MNKHERQPDLKKPLKEQFVRIVITYYPNRPFNESYGLIRDTFTKKPESREEQLGICQVDTNHVANGLLYYARLMHSMWFKDYGVTAAQVIDSVCDYLQEAHPEPIKNSPAVALIMEFYPDKQKLERYSIERETSDERQLDAKGKYDTMNTDIKHFANGARYLAGVMELNFSEFGLKEREILGKLCIFLKTTIKGNTKELDVIT